MKPERFRSALKLRPFRPILIRTAAGDSYPVNHPEAIWQSEPEGSTVIVGTGGDTFAMLATEHITAFQYLDTKTGAVTD